ncbi:M23 family metallopeptidase [Allocoleopsis franciscana]|uniref:M23 family metallopeptidase n=1 Tax=Allocoleopsis franciscana TaxID=2886352 RepID=UPI0002E7DDEC|nr:M23 family metallopeptidase [Allocoleopsis franciscana]
MANLGTPVLSVEAGTIAFAGKQGGYGNLVVVNHQGGRQTRYAHRKPGVGQDGSVGEGRR